ncbi:phosphoenolpyruvate carboxykinase (ATP) [Paenibacillus sp. YYML68]|uniref:phosphoenolpyruvate carboxykinase (ATP) n=1 Tax=Paenibacillus sp. YYML68 TaxID=2909250 RepID=UPI002492B106|nr:phosphoenolpyruvate carboxykinase (ATP) [Paenibacillus sp. YYML68]
MSLRHANGLTLDHIIRSDRASIQLSVPQLIEAALYRREGSLTDSGALQVTTGTYTGRSPKDKYIVRDSITASHVAWGSTNQPMTTEQFGRLYRKALQYLEQRELFVFDGYAGADAAYRLPVRVVSEYAWHNLFAQQLFIKPMQEELRSHKPAFTVISAPGFKADPAEDGTNSEVVVAISFEERVVLIGGTEYAGEMKKSIFSVLNYLLPFQDVFPMHCSANIGADGDTALFFGLSGTGKTTLSADPNRSLIGDDEHGWSPQGVFNFEGGCYAKCADLAPEKEPEIWQAIRFGTVLENVVLDSKTHVPDYADKTLTENTRAAYPIDFIPNAMIPGVGGHPKTIIFLTADASGVLPPIARLTKEQAMYYFLSGYTSKLAGTERGVTQPVATFSTCFGAPFLPLQPTVYAELLGQRLDEHRAQVYLVNTGWTSGPYGTGSRMKLSYTRAMVKAALAGALADVTVTADPIFGVLVPDYIPGVPNEVLVPRHTWPDAKAYEAAAQELAQQFSRNFEKFSDVADNIRAAGPRVSG